MTPRLNRIPRIHRRPLPSAANESRFLCMQVVARQGRVTLRRRVLRLVSEAVALVAYALALSAGIYVVLSPLRAWSGVGL